MDISFATEKLSGGQPQSTDESSTVISDDACDTVPINYGIQVSAIRNAPSSMESEGETLAADKKQDSKPNISKKQLKRLAKKAKWEETKSERRALEKEKRKKKRLANPDAEPLRSMREKLKLSTMANSNCRVGVVIDLSLDEYMTEKSLASCMKQIQHCYSINRRAANGVQFHISSLTGKSLTEISKNTGYNNWDVNFHDKHFMDVFEKDKIIYLTAESDNVIEKLENDKFYVIGGLVDHNSHKGLCHELAVAKGLNHARLPIDEYISLKTRKVLTIDHVFHILVKVCNGESWKDAFLEVLPKRKGAKDISSDDGKDSIQTSLIDD